MMAEVGGREESLLPKNRVKFMCSHGGKILPRPVDGHLKYVGGQTRVIAVARDINFSELMEKLNSLFEGDMVLKYQLIPEDLDALVSVTCDEDVHHMLDEYDRHDAKLSESSGTPRLRAFLFPSNPILDSQTPAAHSHTTHAHALEQRYIDAINGVVRKPVRVRRTSSNTSHPTFSISSNGSPSKPNPPDGCTIDSINNMVARKIMRVHSSPSLGNLAHQQQQQQPSHQLQQHQQQPLYQPSRLQGSLKGGNRKLASILSIGRSDIERSHMEHNGSWNYPQTRCHERNGGYISHGHGYADKFGVYRSGSFETAGVP